MTKLTPMMQQYQEIKKNYPDCILFFRLGDFYEMFFEDALIASKVLEIVLTQRDCGNNEKSPMCGVPYHVAEPYISKLVTNGYKVAICDQLEDPSTAKGIVKRDVIRIVSPGTLLDTEVLTSSDHNYLMSLFIDSYGIGLSYCDLTTGDVSVSEVDRYLDQNFSILEEQIVKLKPSEILVNKNLEGRFAIFDDYANKYHIYINYVDDKSTMDDYKKIIVKHIPKDMVSSIVYEKSYALISLSNLISYIYRFQNEPLLHLKKIQYISLDQYLQIDANTRMNLEIHQNLYTRKKKGSLQFVLDKTSTAMGGRLLNRWLENPLLDPKQISVRQNMVEALVSDQPVREEIHALLHKIYDIERICGKLAFGRATGKDLISLKISVGPLPEIKNWLIKMTNSNLKQMGEELDTLVDIFNLIDRSIVEDPPLAVTEGNLIKVDYDPELDQIRSNKILGLENLVEYEASERIRTGIRNLKIVFHKKSGYFLDITKANQSKLPPEYVCKQTLTNSNRYTTGELDRIQTLILSAEGETAELEYRIFSNIRSEILGQIQRLQMTCQSIALLDVLVSLALVAQDNGYTKPSINTDGIIQIQDGRHPIVEQALAKHQFIANDTQIGEKNNRIQIITGPNMSGKSTYMRQIAQIVILAQIGSFVPAAKATIGIVDKIFTRIGASDNLFQGESTFMTEMKEMSHIIQNGTANSLLILDEIGRGTSTFDGLSLAWAIVEHISNEMKAKTFFATHYHELTQLENQLDNVVNMQIQVEEYDNEIVFLRKIQKGKANRSYGIEVAKLAGFPSKITNRASVILKSIEEKSKDNGTLEISDNEQIQLNDYAKQRLLDQLKRIQVDNMTPMEALNCLHRLSEEAKEL